eukprot:m.113151 g.113151  ORF g.113151 m.113151 type:complete len:68 (-) comp15351_c0_seq1:277-480(-)
MCNTRANRAALRHHGEYQPTPAVIGHGLSLEAFVFPSPAALFNELGGWDGAFSTHYEEQTRLEAMAS